MRYDTKRCNTNLTLRFMVSHVEAGLEFQTGDGVLNSGFKTEVGFLMLDFRPGLVFLSRFKTWIRFEIGVSNHG